MCFKVCSKKYGFTVLSVEDLMKCNSLVFKVDIKVCNVEDAVRTQNAISYWTKKAEHQSNNSTLLTVISKMAEDIAAVRVSQRLMKLQVDRVIDEKSSREDTERMKFEKWMENKVNLPQYLELFIENGFEDLKCMRGITMEHLWEMRIDKMGHRMKLMKNIPTLKAVHE